jgi:hypothetical protein
MALLLDIKTDIENRKNLIGLNSVQAIKMVSWQPGWARPCDLRNPDRHTDAKPLSWDEKGMPVCGRPSVV